MADAKEILTPELIQQIEETARRENRRPSEVLEDAWHRCVEEKSWVELVERGRENILAVYLWFLAGAPTISSQWGPRLLDSSNSFGRARFSTTALYG
jgi:hypothetical protein